MAGIEWQIDESHECVNACITNVNVKTTGYMGGDSGHGGRTQLTIEWDGADVEATFENDKLVLKLGGDAELDTLRQALAFVVFTLGEAH